MAKRGRKPKKQIAQETPIAGGLRSVKEKRNILKEEKTEDELRREIIDAKPKPLPPKLDELATEITSRMQAVVKEADLSQTITVISNAVQLALEPFYQRLEKLLLVCARLAAADTMRTSQSCDTVFSRSLDEAAIAKKVMEEKQ